MKRQHTEWKKVFTNRRSDEELIPRIFLKKPNTRTFLSVQWLKLWAYTAGGSGSIPGGEDLGSHMTHSEARKKQNFYNSITHKKTQPN